jgi:predicted phage terminase large subunit-like protein
MSAPFRHPISGVALSRAQAERYIALCRERNEREERRRLETERGAIVENCATLHGFIREFWYVLEPTTPFVTGWAIKAMCEHLEAVHRGEIQNLLITVPPGMMKSLLVSVFFQAWEWGPKGRPDLRYLSTSYSDDNVGRDSNKVRKLVESEKYRALWGDKVKPSAKWGEHKFENTAGGNRDCRPFGSLTGGRGDRVLIDDPHSTKTAESDTVREETVKLFREGATDRLNDISTSATIVIMQRLHGKDVAGEILSLGIGYVHLNLPMEFEPAHRCVTPIFTDPRTTKGELLFPQRFPAGPLATLKRAKGTYAWSGQYQQNPTPRGGGLFQRTDFKIVGALPNTCGAAVRAWDYAATEDTGDNDPDYTAGVKMRRCTATQNFYVEHVERGRWSPANSETVIINTASQDGAATKIRLPIDPGATGKIANASFIKKLAGYNVKAERMSGDKVVRATPAAVQVEAGNVLLLRGDWNEAFIDELCRFPRGGHDDQVDAFSDALNELALGHGPAKITKLRI